MGARNFRSRGIGMGERGKSNLKLDGLVPINTDKCEGCEECGLISEIPKIKEEQAETKAHLKKVNKKCNQEKFCDKHYKEMEKIKKKFTTELENVKSQLNELKGT